MLNLLKTVTVKHYAAAVILGVVVFACCHVLGTQQQCTVNITTIVNVPGAMLNGSALRLSLTDTSKLNPYNRLKEDIHDLQELQYNPAFEKYPLSIEPGTQFYNSLEVSLNAKCLQEGKALLYKLIKLYNVSHRKNHLGQYSLSKKISDQVERLGYQLLFLQNFSDGAHNEEKLRRATETLIALSFYVEQPISQFSLIPNTYDLENKRIASLILSYNELQNKKQHLLSNDKYNVEGLSLLNNQLCALQSDLTVLIDNDQQMIKRVLNIVSLENKKDYSQFKDSLVMSYARLVQLNATANGSSTVTGRLVVVGKPQVANNRWPLIKAISISVIAAISLMLVLVLNSPIGMEQIRSFFIDNDNVIESPVPELLNAEVKSLPSKLRSIPVGEIANLMQQKSRNGNVFLFTRLAGGSAQLDLEVAISNDLASQFQTVVMVNLDFSGNTTINGGMDSKGIGVKDFIADESILVDGLLQKSVHNASISIIGLGQPSVNNFKESKTEFSGFYFPTFNEDLFINHPRIKLLINELRPRFNYVFLQAAALASPADVLPFSNAADHSIVVVKRGELTTSMSSKINAWAKAGNLKDVSLIEV